MLIFPSAGSDLILRCVFRVQGVKVMGVELLEIGDVIVRVKLIFIELDHGDGDVGAVVGHALEIGQQVVEDEADLQRAGARLQALDVAELKLVAEHVNMLLQRLDLIGLLQILVDKGGKGEGKDLVHCAEQHIHLMLAVFREADLFVVLLLRDLTDVHGVVADTLEVAERVQILGDPFVLLGIEFRAVELHEVGTDLVLVAVDQFLILLHLLRKLVGILVEQHHGVADIFTRLLGHGVDGYAALLNGKGGMLEEALVQAVKDGVGLTLLAALLDEGVEQLLHRAEEGQQQHRAHGAENRVHERDAHRAHDHFGEGKMQHAVGSIEHDGDEYRADALQDEVGMRRAATGRPRAERGEHDRHRRADPDTDQERERLDKADRAGDRERLQNTDGRGRALQHSGEGRAGEDAEQRV